MADRLFRTVQTGQEKETVGFLRFLFLKTKRYFNFEILRNVLS